LEAIISVLANFWNAQREMLLVMAFSAGFFYFSRHWLKREVFRNKTLMSIIVSMAFPVANAQMVAAAYFTNDYITAFYQQSGLPAIPPSFWANCPLVVMIFVSLFLQDFVIYWCHRFMHMRWLWPIHAIHHSDPDVNGFTTYRVHILEIVFCYALLALLLPWLGMPAEVSAMTGLSVVLLNAYVHFDVDWHHGPFKYLIASPRFHKWHHADTPEYYGKNLANIFPIFDVMFGTYHVPGPCNEPMGAVGVPENNFVKLMAFPITEWATMLRQSFKSDNSMSVKPPVLPAE
jgi:sterol desaturase/sphingolipid hydroxylase (fatty acid hydroxylase superfamily)